MFRFAEPVVRELAAAGHDVRVSFALPDDVQDDVVVSDAGARLVPFAAGGTSRGARAVDLHRTLASYMSLRRRWPPLLRERWLDYFPSKLVRTLRAVDAAGLSLLIDGRQAARLATALTRLWPVPSSLVEQLREVQPDVVVASPLVFPGSREVDAIRAAQRAGVPTVGLVLSWDNLTSKGLFHAVPDRVLVWNEAQVDEAVGWHAIPRDRIDILGAPVFDYLFEVDRRGTRQCALAELDLSPGARYVVYGGSSQIGLGPGGEIEIVVSLLRALHAVDWGAEGAPLLVVRPHPNNPTGWSRVHADGLLVQETSGFPTGEDARNELALLLAHADAVIGLNTSLFIDAAILDVPAVALSLSTYEKRDRVPNRLTHFEHLVRAGFLSHADDPAAASSLLVKLRRDGDFGHANRIAFVRRFIRPQGLDRPAAGLVAERLASLG